MRFIVICCRFLVLGCIYFSSQAGVGQVVDIPDTNFLSWLITRGVDLNSDGQIQEAEAERIIDMEISFSYEPITGDIHSLAGIEAFVNLEFLSCAYQPITEVDLRSLENLKSLDIANTNISEIDISQNLDLTYLTVFGTPLYQIDASNNSRIRQIHYHNMPNLLQIDFRNLDYDLSTFDYGSVWEVLTGDINDPLRITTPNLFQICVDPEDYPFFDTVRLIDNIYWPLDTLCVDITLDTFDEDLAISLVDTNGDGCDSSDIPYPFMPYSVASDSQQFQVIGRHSGTLPQVFPFGDYRIEALPVHDYFSVAPDSIRRFTPIPVPADTFCLQPIDDIYDVELSLLPIGFPRPGFRMMIDIVYENVGTLLNNGDIIFEFIDSLHQIDASHTSPAPDSVLDGRLIWHVEDLGLFERDRIRVALIPNSPQDSPPLIGGENLSYAAEYRSQEVDQTLGNNSANINLVVINSFDPNDKTCLQGSILQPEALNGRIDYLIRFENIGTAEAVDVVIRDAIDTTMFNPLSLRIVDASHDGMYVQFDSGYVYRFVFEDINLPFADSINDGYVAFSIQPRNGLGIGDSLVNSAEIYFDFNDAIHTNREVSIVQELFSSQVLVQGTTSSAIEVVPNPFHEQVQIHAEEGIEGYMIYSSEGRLLQAANVDASPHFIELNTANWPSGMYFLMIRTQDGYLRAKLLRF